MECLLTRLCSFRLARPLATFWIERSTTVGNWQLTALVVGLDKRLSLHSLRHGYVSLLLARGEQLVNVSRWLGHRKLSTTERVYVHQIESLDDLAAENMRERERLAGSVASTA